MSYCKFMQMYFIFLNKPNKIIDYVCIMRKLIKFKSPKAKVGLVDFDNKILRDVVLIEPNREASGHGMYVDQKMVNQVVELGNAGGDIGFKARFDHPNACANSTMGTQLGRLKNYRINDEGKAIADLHIGGYTEHSPNGDIGKWLLSVANEDPDQVGFSIVFEAGEPVTFEAGKDEDPDQPKFMYPHARIKTFHGADVVDEGAATSSLFEDGIQGRPNYLAEQAELWLTDKSDLVKTVLKPLVSELLTELNINNNKTQSNMSKENDKVSLLEKIQTYLSSEPVEANVEDKSEALEVNELADGLRVELLAATEQVEALTVQLETSATELSNKTTEHNTVLLGLKSEVEALKSESLGSLVNDVALSSTSVEPTEEQKTALAAENKEANIMDWAEEGFNNKETENK